MGVELGPRGANHRGAFVAAMAVVVCLAGCGGRAGSEAATPETAATSSVTEAPAFPTAAFAALSEEALPEMLTVSLQQALDEAAGSTGMTATLIMPDGMWTGVTGRADPTRAMLPEDQMAIASITKTVVATQVMQLVQAGEVALEEEATEYLPSSLDFDSNEATVGDLMGMRSGIPDYIEALWSNLSTDKLHVWTTEELLALVEPDRAPAGSAFEYSSTNYILLGLIIEEVTGQPVAEVLRQGVLSGAGHDRLIYQLDERPTEPMAAPDGGAEGSVEDGGGYLPSLAGASAAGAAGGMASDSATLAQWWGRLCGGQIISAASLGIMTDFQQTGDYGLGIGDASPKHGRGAVGHEGSHVGSASYAGCLPEHSAVIAVLANDEHVDPYAAAEALVEAGTSQ